jgi:hypothetical protein
MLLAALVCPHPPLLLPGLTGATDVEPALRLACRQGLEALTGTGPDVVVLIGSATRSRSWGGDPARGTERFTAGRGENRSIGAGPAPGGPAPSGPTPSGPGTEALPLSLAVGQQLLDDAGWTGPRELVSVARDAPVTDCLALGGSLARTERRLALLVMGDGSARRGLRAPGYLDDRAAGYDEQARKGLAGDPAALICLDPVVGEQLLVAGRAPWQVLAAAAATAPGLDACLRYADDPFGVQYIVASWTTRTT